MGIERTRRRAAWAASVAAAVAGSAVVAVVAAQRRRGAPATNGAAPVLKPVPAPVPEPAPLPEPEPESELPVAPATPEEPTLTVAHDVLGETPSTDEAPEPQGFRRARVLTVAAVIVGIGLAVAAVVALQGGGDDKPVAAATTDVPRTTTTGVADLSPTDAFAQAAQRLRVSRTFAYTGTSAATDVSAVRPGLWLAVDLTVTGEVDLVDGRIHEIGTATSGRVSETVSDGITTWGRLADRADSLADQDFRPVDQPRQAKVPLGAALLPDWLDRSVDRQSGGDGMFQAQLPAEVLGVIVGGVDPVPAQLRLTLGPDGAPTHVEVTVTDGPPFHLAYDLTRRGAVSPVTLPA